jgi:hypothetical protein
MQRGAQDSLSYWRDSGGVAFFSWAVTSKPDNEISQLKKIN